MNEQGGTSSAASCNNGHAFFYAGTPPIPDGFPCACGLTKYRASTTNDPQAAYGKKREPMLSNDGIHDLMPPNDNIGASVNRSVGGLIVRDHYEALIASGELIVKSELVEWLKAERAEDRQMRDDLEVEGGDSDIYDGRQAAFNEVLYRINKKGSTTP